MLVRVSHLTKVIKCNKRQRSKKKRYPKPVHSGSTVAESKASPERTLKINFETRTERQLSFHYEAREGSEEPPSFHYEAGYPFFIEEKLAPSFIVEAKKLLSTRCSEFLFS